MHVQGQNLGINVANYMADNYFQPVGRDSPRGRMLSRTPFFHPIEITIRGR